MVGPGPQWPLVRALCKQGEALPTAGGRGVGTPAELRYFRARFSPLSFRLSNDRPGVPARAGRAGGAGLELYSTETRAERIVIVLPLVTGPPLVASLAYLN